MSKRSGPHWGLRWGLWSKRLKKKLKWFLCLHWLGLLVDHWECFLDSLFYPMHFSFLINVSLKYWKRLQNQHRNKTDLPENFRPKSFYRSFEEFQLLILPLKPRFWRSIIPYIVQVFSISFQRQACKLKFWSCFWPFYDLSNKSSPTFCILSCIFKTEFYYHSYFKVWLRVFQADKTRD